MLQKWTTATTVMLFLLLYLTAQEWMKWHCFKVKNFKIQQQQQRNQLRENQIPKNTPKKFFVFFFVKKCDVVFAKKCFVCFFSFLQIAKKNANEVKKNRFATKWEYIFFNYFLLLLCLEKNCPAYQPNEWASRKVDWNTRCEFGKNENFMAVFTRIYANISI